MENHIHIYSVTGMSCNHCKNKVETNLRTLPGVDTVEADIVNNKVTLKGSNINSQQVQQTILLLGYQFHGEIES